MFELLEDKLIGHVGDHRVYITEHLVYGRVLVYVAIFFGLSTLVRLGRPCSMYVCIFVGLGTLVRL